MTPEADQLFERSVDEVRRGDVRAALGTLLDTLAADPRHAGALDAAGHICRLMGSMEDAQLFEDLAAQPDSADALYALGYRLVDQARPDTAAVLLERCLGLQPEHAPTRRELAYARLHSHDFTGCLTALDPLQDDSSLAETEQLDIVLLQAEAALYAYRRDKAQARLTVAEAMLADDDQRARLDALYAMVGRSQHWKRLDRLGLREWHFIQHAGVILKTAGGYFEDSSLGGRFDVLALRTDMIAFLLRRYLDLAESWGVTHGVIASVTETSAPLAQAVAQTLGVPCIQDLDDRAGRSTLLLAASGSEVAGMAPELATHRSDLTMLTLCLDWHNNAWVCPEVVGVLAKRVLLPWESRFTLSKDGASMEEIPGDPRTAADIGEEVATAMTKLPEFVSQARAEFEAFYEPLRAELTFGNEERYPYRREFTHLSPWKASPESEADDEN
jgi:tetratricopeptide (TPR) repeat protein